MDSLYQSPPYAYLPQQSTSDSFHQYRPSNSTSTSFDRPFHMEHNEVNSYGGSSNNDWYPSSHHHHYHHGHHHHHASDVYDSYHGSHPNSASNPTNGASIMSSPRFKITTNVWEDEGTFCYQVDAKGICVARRQDNDMINGTKLLNVVGMSRGKRDGILKNEKGRVVVKVGAMHLKGVWIPFSRATELAEKFKILDVLYPLLVDDPSHYVCNNIGANNETIPPPVIQTKCNMASSPLPFSHRLPSEPYSFVNSHHNSTYDLPQVLHRNSAPSLSTISSPVPDSHHHPSTNENDLYLLNNNHHHHHNNNNNNSSPYDCYTSRPNTNNNRGSFSSISSHQSYLYPSLHHEDDTSKTSSVTTPTSYADHYGNRSLAQEKSLYNTSPPYFKSSPYAAATATTIPPLQTTNETAVSNNRNGSAGSTTPSSWFSPETPTAVLFGVNKEDATTTSEQQGNSKKRKASTSSCIEANLKTLKKPNTTTTTVSLPPASPIRATKRLGVHDDQKRCFQP